METQATGMANFKAGPTVRSGVTLFIGEPVSANGTLAEGVIAEPDPGTLCGWVESR